MNTVLGSQDRAPWRWVTLPSGPVIAIDASLGFHFRVILTENAALEPPANGASGQEILLRIENAGSYTLTPNAALVFRNGESTLPLVASGTVFAVLRYDDVTHGWEIATALSRARADALYLTIAAAAAGYQPLDSDLTAIAALSTTSYGRGFLTLANAAAAQTTIGGTAAGIALFTGASAAAQRTSLGLGSGYAANIMSAQADSTALLVADLVTDFNALLAKLRAAGLMTP